MKRSFYVIFCLLGCFYLNAQYTISGTVTIGPDQDPLPGWLIFAESQDGTVFDEIETDTDGFYSLSVDIDNTNPTIILISSIDPCTGVLVQEQILASSTQTDYTVDLDLCGFIDPPVTDSCQAFFTSQTIDDGTLSIQFTNLSSTIDPIDVFEWDFGDGNISSEESPIHTYQSGGVYGVTLSITSGNCTDSELSFLTIFDLDNCDCPDTLNPVCVVDFTGELITYENSCLAECAGYPSDVQFSCDADCFCPTFLSPVCVVDNSGDTLTFDNHCFASCEGFTADQWFACDVASSDPCDCNDVLQPVCVLDSEGNQIGFDSPCQAECAGFTVDQFIVCDPCPVDLSEFGIDEICVVNASGDTISYTNICEATIDGYDFGQFFICGTFDCSNCSNEYDPVCVLLPGGNETFKFSNECLAFCAGYSSDDFVDCQPADPCDCGHDLLLVCVENEEGEQLQFENPCQAICAGYTEDQFMFCDPCPIDIVFGFPTDSVYCGIGEDGDTITFANLCEALFLGYDFEDLFACGDIGTDCNCFHVFDPVCVNDSISGEIIEFENSCFAECAGYTNDQFVLCNPLDTCECDGEPFQPICVLDENGEQVSFENPCLAKCAGHFEFEFVVCDPCPYDITIDFPENLQLCAIIEQTDETITFETICEAAFAGFSVEDLFLCDTTPTPPIECQAEFTANPISDDGLSLQFESFGESFDGSPVVVWSWDFGDGNVSTEQNPIHTYAAPGMYEVTLTISTLEGCTSTVSFGILAGEDDGSGMTDIQCQSFFFVEQPDPENLLLFQFVDVTLGAVEAWSWDFGDGGTSDQQHPIYEYAEPGEYTVTLTATGNGCQSVVSITLQVGDDIFYGDFDCRAWFLPIITSDSTVFFFNLSSADAETFAWSLGDGTGSSDYEIFHTYPGPGTYTVSLTIESNEGCQNTFSATITLGEEVQNFVSQPSFRILNSTSEVDRAEAVKLLVAPNPTAGDVQIQWQSLSSGQVDYQLVDAQGRLTLNGRTEAIAGINQLTLSLADQPAGMYMIRLRTAEGIAVQRLIKK
ncbi:MAG: PKD domain-containing protein [Bacteroidota bacterium]